MSATVILAMIGRIGSGFWAFLSSTIGQIVIAFVIAWFWSGYRTANYWQAKIDAEHAIQRQALAKETARQEEAAREIAQAATERVVEEMSVADNLREQIADLEREETKNDKPTVQSNAKVPPCTPVVVRPCRVDDAFADRVRRLDAAARRAPQAAPRAR